MSAAGASVRVPEVGDAVPGFERDVTAASVMAYGAATWDWHRLHYDLEYARARGLPGVVLDGQSFGAFFARAAVDWLGPRAFVRKLSFRMRSMVFPGDRIRCDGEVTAVETTAEATLVRIAERLRVGERLAADAELLVSLPRPGTAR